MSSRVERFNENYDDTNLDRTLKNKQSYEEAYDYDEAGIDTITNLYETREIDMAKLKKIIEDDKKLKKDEYKDLNDVETLEEENFNSKYDINSMIEKKKEERIPTELLDKYHKLEDKDLSLEKTNINSKKLQMDTDAVKDLTEKIQTGELEIRNLLNTINITKTLIQEEVEALEKLKQEDDLNLEILKELKPDDEGTLIEGQENIKEELKKKEKVSYLDENTKESIDDSFYSKSLKFNKEDFDEDVIPIKKKRNKTTIIMIIIIFIIIALLIVIGIYAYNNYLK